MMYHFKYTALSNQTHDQYTIGGARKSPFYIATGKVNVNAQTIKTKTKLHNVIANIQKNSNVWQNLVLFHNTYFSEKT